MFYLPVWSLYIYIYIYLLTYSLPAFRVTRKKEKKTPVSRDNNISNYPPGEKKNIIGQKKKEKANFVTRVEKNHEKWNQLVKIKRKPTVKCCNAKITESAQYKVEPITKIKSVVGPILLKFRLTEYLSLPPTRHDLTQGQKPEGRLKWG